MGVLGGSPSSISYGRNRAAAAAAAAVALCGGGRGNVSASSSAFLSPHTTAFDIRRRMPSPTMMPARHATRLMAASSSASSSREFSSELKAASLEMDAKTPADSTGMTFADYAGVAGADGEVLNFYYERHGGANDDDDRTFVAGRGGRGFAVVRMRDDDDDDEFAAAVTAKTKTNGLGDEKGESGGEEEEADHVELAKALSGKPPPPGLASEVAAKTKSANGGIMADGDLTGRIVSFRRYGKSVPSHRGTVVAHRYPIAFVLVDADEGVGVGAPEDNDASADTTATATLTATTKPSCTISRELTMIDAASIPPGSVVDYRGRNVRVNSADGSICASLPLPRADNNANGVQNGKEENNDLLGGMFSLKLPNDSAATGRAVFSPIPKISDIGLIDSPLVTGVTAIDALTPIGRGQNMLIVGRDGNGMKRSLVMDVLKHVLKKKEKGGEKATMETEVRCFYGATSADPKIRADVVSRIEGAGMTDNIITVVSTRDSGGRYPPASGDRNTENEDTSRVDVEALDAAEAVAVAAAACALGEHHALSTGGDALVVIDDIDMHKSLWDATTQSLVRIYGTDAVVEADLKGGSSSEMRGYFSGLIQRAQRFNKKRGGGSVTLLLLSTLLDNCQKSEDSGTHDDDEAGVGAAFEASDFDTMSEKIRTRVATLVKANVPLTSTNLQKIKIPLPRASASENARLLVLQHVDDLISMSDGQIWLDDDLPYARGMRPPLDPTRSITRVGVGADTKTCRADAPALRTVAGSLRFEFQQASDLINSSKGEGATASGSSAADKSMERQVRRRDAFLLAMHQESGRSRSLSEECIVLLAASNGQLDGVVRKGGGAGTEAGVEAIEGLILHVRASAGDVLADIDDTLDMTTEGKVTLEESIASFFSNYEGGHF